MNSTFGTALQPRNSSGAPIVGPLSASYEVQTQAGGGVKVSLHQKHTRLQRTADATPGMAVLTTDVAQQVVLKAPAVSVYSNGSTGDADKFCVDVKYYTPLTSFVPSATITSTDQCGPRNSINTTVIR